MNDNQFKGPDGEVLIFTRAGLYEVSPLRKTSKAFYITSDRLDSDSVYKVFEYKSELELEKERERFINWLSSFN